ncbi:hypothetical protein MMC13_002722 [Lambiella insularis]|nr:hypothetical protein [Lambiella insularis]
MTPLLKIQENVAEDLNELPAPPAKRTQFLDLPVELRLMIYEFAFSRPSSPESYGGWLRHNGGSKSLWAIEPCQNNDRCAPGTTNIMRVNKQIYTETKPVLYSQFTFKVSVGTDRSVINQLGLDVTGRLGSQVSDRYKSFLGAQDTSLIRSVEMVLDFGPSMRNILQTAEEHFPGLTTVALVVVFPEKYNTRFRNDTSALLLVQVIMSMAEIFRHIRKVKLGYKCPNPRKETTRSLQWKMQILDRCRKRIAAHEWSAPGRGGFLLGPPTS